MGRDLNGEKGGAMLHSGSGGGGRERAFQGEGIGNAKALLWETLGVSREQ